MSTPSGPRRRAVAVARRRPAGAWAGLVLLALGVGAVLLTPDQAAVQATTVTARGGPVTDALLACPDLPADDGVTTRFLAGSAPGRTRDGGTLRAGALGTSGDAVDLTRGALVEVPARQGDAPQLTAEGGVAAGLFAFRTDTGRTQAVGTCAAPRASWWFTGAGASLDHGSTLLVSNVDPGPAVIDIRVLGRDGPVETVGTRGMTIAPGTSETINLADVAPQTEDAAVRVLATRGRVVAAMSDSFAARAGAAKGVEWLPDQVLPSRTLRLAGLPAKAASRTIIVANPSEREAVVEVEIAGSSGAFSPAGLDELTIPPGTVETVDLGDTTGAEATAVRLRSRVPVTGAVRSTTTADTTYAAPVLPLSGPAAAPVLARGQTTVQLSAGERASPATVTAFDASGDELDSTTLTVKPGATATWRPGAKAAYVVVTPQRGKGRGAVYGALSVAGPGVTTVPLVALSVRVGLPVVAPAIY